MYRSIVRSGIKINTSGTCTRFMSEEAKPKPKRVICRPTSNLKVGIVGLPNIGKSWFFNLAAEQNVPSENYPFCTIDPNNASVAVPDPRFDLLRDLYKPASKISAVLNITDIAGIVSGASEGKGLGNAFLSHIGAVDALFHLVRVFPDASKEVQHVEGSIDPVRDMEIISKELLQKDLALIDMAVNKAVKAAKSGSDPKKQLQMTTYKKAQELIKSGVDVREGEWTDGEIDCLVEANLLTAKPIVYLLNASAEQYLSRHSPHLKAAREWIAKRSPGSTSILFSADLESDLQMMDPEEKEEYMAELKSEIPIHPEGLPLVDFNGQEPSYLQVEAVKLSESTNSMIPAIITSGYNALRLIQFFTVGVTEVRSWTVREGSTAPQAAGVIHGDFEKNFVCAEVTSYEDILEYKCEDTIKKLGKMKTQGKGYIVNDGDCMLFKHGAKK